MSPLSLHYRLKQRLLTGMAALLVVFVAALGALWVRDQSIEFDRSLESKARTLLELTQKRGTTPDLAVRQLVELEDGQRSTFFAVRLADGMEEGSTEFANITLPDGSAGRQVEIGFLPLHSPGRTAAVVVAVPRQPLLWKAARASLTLLGLGGLLLLALALLVRHVLRRGLEPVVGLRRQIETLDPSHRGQRVNLQAPPDELAPVLRRINELIERTEMTPSGEQWPSR